MNHTIHVIGWLLQKYPSIDAGVGALVMATILSMPEKIPTRLQEFWTWMRDSLQSAVPNRRPVAHSESLVAVHPQPSPPALPTVKETPGITSVEIKEN